MGPQRVGWDWATFTFTIEFCRYELLCQIAVKVSKCLFPILTLQWSSNTVLPTVLRPHFEQYRYNLTVRCDGACLIHLGSLGNHVSVLGFYFKVQKFYQAVSKCDSIIPTWLGQPFINLGQFLLIFFVISLFFFFWNSCLHIIDTFMLDLFKTLK